MNAFSAAAALVAMLVWFPVVATRAQTDTIPANVTLRDLLAHPDWYRGTPVRVRGVIRQVFNPTLFALDEDSFWDDQRYVLVMTHAVISAKPNTKVVVVGEVKRFHRQTMSTVGAVDPPPTDDQWLRWETRPVVIARFVRTSDGRKLLGDMKRH